MVNDMGTKLVINNADFSSVAIGKSALDTAILNGQLYQASLGADGQPGTTQNNRVCTDVFALADLGIAVGDTIKVHSPNLYGCGYRHGDSPTNLPTNKYWFVDENATFTLTGNKGATYVIPAGTTHIGITLGKSDGTTTTNLTANIPVADVRSLLESGAMHFEIIKA